MAIIDSLKRQFRSVIEWDSADNDMMNTEMK